ncbi:MAG TPA: hypothetical protein VM120_22870 [Bryobacteraceae bacterium]|nr:hypothetical protein [Bryobacteraceae bacterium]
MMKQLKCSAMSLCKRTGLLDTIAESKWRSNRLAILCYHGIAMNDEHFWRPRLYMPPELFYSRLDLLKRNRYTVLPLADGIERLYAKDLPPKSVSITFDDGFYDFYALARPALESHDFSSTVYLTTFYSEFCRPVFPLMCSYLLWRALGRELSLSHLISVERSIVLNSRPAIDAAARELEGFANRFNLTAEDKDCLLSRLAISVNIDYEEVLARRTLSLMNSSEVASLPARMVNVQLHTHRHRTPDNKSLFQREIDDNRSRLTAVAGNIATHFCYPSGIHHSRFMPWLRERGVVSATTCHYGLATSQCNPLLLPRLVDHSFLTPVEFEYYLNGLSTRI